MTDPYSVLGITRDADEATIKKAYRTLSKKYHPDNNPGNTQAEEQFKRIQNAYEQIMNEKKNGYSSYGNPFEGFSDFRNNTSGQTDSVEQDLRSAAVYIQNGYYTQALNVLNGMTDRPHTWYYYSAIANMKIGNNITALEHAKMALSLDPGNYSYQKLVSALENGNEWYADRSSFYEVNPFNSSKMCFSSLAFCSCMSCLSGNFFPFFFCL